MVIFILIIFLVAMVVANYMLDREARSKEEMHDRRIERFSQLMENLKGQNGDVQDQKNHDSNSKEQTEESK